MPLPIVGAPVMDIVVWLRSLGLGKYEAAFRENDIDETVLPSLTHENLKELGVSSLGHRVKLLDAIAALRNDASGKAPSVDAGTTSSAPSAHPEDRAERRQVTVMFSDLVGSTALSARMDPEDLREVISAYQKCVAETVQRFGGFVAKYMGDGVLVYFGYPQAHEDDAERAVRAGLELVSAVTALKTRVVLQARVGIATGLVVVGDLIGSGASQEQAIVGETPNLAARLQELAAPGGVVISERTRRLLGDLFTYKELGGTHLKGFAEPVPAWNVVGETADSRFDAQHGASMPPLIGRDQELALLLDRWERAKEGEGQVVLLSGEPGIGKSRLVRGLRERLAGESHTLLRHFCSPYHTNSALHPIIGLLERGAELRPGDPPDRQLDKLEAMLALAVADVEESAALFADLLGINTSGRYRRLDLSPQLKKEKTFQALLEQLAGLAVRQPVLSLYEDVHWIDPTMLELLGRVVDRVQRIPVLAVITFRPEFFPPWKGHGHVTALSLSRLGRRQGAAMVGRVTAGKSLPAEVLEQILAKTDGVPLFVEELTKTVIESGLLRDQGDCYELAGPLPPLAIPATLQDDGSARPAGAG